MYFPKPAINENDLAIIERGDTASHSIEAGQYVSWKGKLGKANSAILQGASLDSSLFEYDDEGVINVFNNNLGADDEANVSSGDTSVTANTDTTLCTKTFSHTGVYLVLCVVTLRNNNASGGFTLKTASSGLTNLLGTPSVYTSMPTGTYRTGNVIRAVSVKPNDTLSLIVSSNVATTYGGYMYFMRLK